MGLLVWALVAVQLAPSLMFSGVAVILPQLGRDLDASAIELGLVETLFLAGTLGAMLPVGQLADAWDKRSLFKLGLLAFGLSSLLIGLLEGMWAVLALRLVQGFCAATSAATGPAILVELVPKERRGMVFGASMAATYLGLALGPVLAGVLAEWTGWRSVFWVGGSVLVLGSGLIHSLLRSSWPRVRAWPHVPSAAVWGLAVVAWVFGAAEIKEPQLGVPLLGAGALLGGAFFWLQRRIERPLLDLRAMWSNVNL